TVRRATDSSRPCHATRRRDSRALCRASVSHWEKTKSLRFRWFCSSEFGLLSSELEELKNRTVKRPYHAAVSRMNFTTSIPTGQSIAAVRTPRRTPVAAALNFTDE